MFILITGNPVDGYDYIGPFPNRDEAIRAGDDTKEKDWWIAELTDPVEDLLLEKPDA